MRRRRLEGTPGQELVSSMAHWLRGKSLSPASAAGLTRGFTQSSGFMRPVLGSGFGFVRQEDDEDGPAFALCLAAADA